MNKIIQIIQRKVFTYNILNYIFYYCTILYSLLKIIFNLYTMKQLPIYKDHYIPTLLAVNYLTYLNFN